MDETDATLNALERLTARVDALHAACERLAAENAQLRASGGGAQLEAAGAGAIPGEDVSRRGLLRTAVGVAAAAGAAAVALERPEFAGANTGDNVIAGQTTLANSGTQLKWNGSSGFTGVLLLGNDTGFDDTGAFYPAAAGGWAGGGAAGVPNGVYGYTQTANGNGVVGFSASSGNGVVGFSASSGNGCGVLGTAQAAAAAAVPGSYGVLGQVGSTLPSLPTTQAGVAGQARGFPGVVGASGTNVGVYGVSTSGSGVRASSKSSYGVQAAGGKAQLYLVPASTAGKPTTGSHELGELFLDRNGALFVCTTSGSPGTWKTVNVS